jgi:hypothetical protein
MKDAAVGISTVTKPSGHSRNGHLSTENPSCFDLPRNRVDERPCDCRPIKLCAMIADQNGLAVIGQNIALGHDSAQPINEGIQYAWRNPMETCKRQPIEIAESERFGDHLKSHHKP